MLEHNSHQVESGIKSRMVILDNHYERNGQYSRDGLDVHPVCLKVWEHQCLIKLGQVQLGSVQFSSGSIRLN